MEAVARKPGIAARPLGMLLAVLVIAMVWSLFPANPAILSLLAIVVLFFYGINRPVWAIVALLVAQLTITSFMVPLAVTEISLRLLLILLTGIILFRARSQIKIDFGPKAKRLVKPILILIGISVFVNLIYSGFDYAFKDLRNMLVGLLMVLFLPAAIRNTKHLKTICGIVFIIIFASTLVALLQHFHFMGLGQNTIIPGYFEQWGDNLRVPGMSESELELSYILSVAIIAVVGIFLFKGVNLSNRKIMLISIFLMGIALYFTYTRSALIALALGLIGLFLFVKTRIRGEFIFLALLFCILLLAGTGIMEGSYLGGRDEGSQSESSLARKILWQAGLAIVMDNPILGIGGDQFLIVSPSYSNAVDDDLIAWEESQYWAYRTLGNEGVHNDFLNIWLSYGTIALIVYIWMNIMILQNFLLAYRKSKDRFLRGISVGLAGGLIAYLVNSFYHNSLQTIPLLWIIGGLSLAVVKLAVKEQINTMNSLLSAGNKAV